MRLSRVSLAALQLLLIVCFESRKRSKAANSFRAVPVSIWYMYISSGSVGRVGGWGVAGCWATIDYFGHCTRGRTQKELGRFLCVVLWRLPIKVSSASWSCPAVPLLLLLLLLSLCPAVLLSWCLAVLVFSAAPPIRQIQLPAQVSLSIMVNFWCLALI